MKLGSKSRALLKEAQTIMAEQSRMLTTASKSGKLTIKQTEHASWQLRVAAAKLEEITGRLFYAGQKKDRKK